MSMLFLSGAVRLVEGEESREVTGLNLPFEPAGVNVSILRPHEDADLIDAYLVDSFSSSGFFVNFSAPIPEDGYRLAWCAYASETPAGQGTLALSYADFFKAVRRFLGYGETLTNDQQDEVDGYIQSGVRQFYYPPANGTRDEVHDWTFLHQDSSIITAEGVASVTVPNVVGRILGPAFHIDGSRAPIPVVADCDIERLRSRNPGAVGRPQFVCLRHKQAYGASGQANEIVFYPTPDEAYTLHFRMECDPKPIDADTNPFPLGGPKYGELVLESCLSVAEQRANDEVGLHTERFTKLLETAIAQDRRSTAENYGPMSGPEGNHARFVRTPYRPLKIYFNGQPI